MSILLERNTKMEFTNFKDLKVYKPDPEKIKKQYEEITNRHYVKHQMKQQMQS